MKNKENSYYAFGFGLIGMILVTLITLIIQ